MSESTSAATAPTALAAEEWARPSKRMRLKRLWRRLLRRASPAPVRIELKGTPANCTFPQPEASLSQRPFLSGGVDVEETPASHAGEVKEQQRTLTQLVVNEVPATSRQAEAADGVDLSGTWKPIVTESFKKEYDAYLIGCGESLVFRKIIVNGIGYQQEAIRQRDAGGALEIVATNPAGNWNRTLLASGAATPRNVTVVDPDGDRVRVEAWWEAGGTRHRSVLRGKPRVQEGAFETVRYLEGDNVLVCESEFVPAPGSPPKFKRGRVVWRFRRLVDK